MTSLKQDKALPTAVLTRVAAALRVLAHPHRLRIVELLETRELTVGELADRLDIPANACSQHLNLMRAHGLLSSSRRGRAVHYRVVSESAKNVLRCIRKNETRGHP